MENKHDKNTLTPTKRIISYNQSRGSTPPRSTKIISSPYSNNNLSSQSSPRKKTFSHNNILHYQQKIVCLENTISNLQKLNETIMKEAKSNQLQLEYLLQRTKDELNKKTNKIYYLQEAMNKMNFMAHDNPTQNRNCQSFRSRAQKNRRNTQQNFQKSRQKLYSKHSNGNTERTIISLKKQLDQVKRLIQSKNAQISKLKQNIKQKQQIWSKYQQEKEIIKNDMEMKEKYYEKIIQEKQSTIRKMAQFNDDLCGKLMQKNNNCLSKTEKKKLELVLHDNKALKEKCLELQNKNLQLESEIQNFVHKCKDMKGIRQEILLIIENQKKIIYQKNMEIQALKYQLLQINKQSYPDREIKNTKATSRFKENNILSKTISNPQRYKFLNELDEPYFQQFQSTCENQSTRIKQKNIQVFEQNFEKFRKLYNYVSKNQMIEQCTEEQQPFNGILPSKYEKNMNIPEQLASPRFNHRKFPSKSDMVKQNNHIKKRSQSIKDPQNLTFAFDDTLQPDNTEEN